MTNSAGHTSALTYYLLNKSYYLVDCPGYGFASVSKSTRKEWHDLTQDYFTSRRTLAMVFLLVDGTQRPQQIDLDCGAWLHENKAGDAGRRGILWSGMAANGYITNAKFNSRAWGTAVHAAHLACEMHHDCTLPRAVNLTND